MTETVGVVVGTFGDRRRWGRLARRALDSAHNQSRPADAIFWCHADTLRDARNYGAEQAETDWFIFLDADDELDPFYIEKMLEAEGDLRQPSTLGLYENGTRDNEPVLIPARPDGLETGNFIVIGAMVRARFFNQVGGFNDYPILEDWDLWRRVTRAGAVIGQAPEAIYKVTVRKNSRNADTSLHGRIYTQIRSQS